MKSLFLILLTAVCGVSFAQRSAGDTKATREMSEAEQKDLRTSLGEAGSSPVEFIRTLEHHLAKYPMTPQREELENALIKAAIESKDNRRILLYGERVLARNMDQPVILERVARVLLINDDKASAEKALPYAKRFEEILRGLEKQGLSTNHNKGQMLDELDRSIGKALVYQARATGNLGKVDEAIALANKSYQQCPTAEAAREIGRWLAKAGRNADAIPFYAEAFTIPDPKVTDQEREKDRQKLAELYRKDHNSEAGLGDIVLQAYDRTSAIARKRSELERQRDPNATVSDPMDYTLTGLEGDKLPLSTLKGKVVVMDFWATWCGPCRAQHPLYEEVKKKFAGNQNVVFVAVNSDEDPSLVKPFLESNSWSKKVYFEDGLSGLLKVNSLPATLIFDKEGKLYSRMNGFVPERFVDMLSERIQEALN